jgi:hypothetical protein
MINKTHGLTLFIAVCFLAFATDTIAREDTNTKDFSIKACLGTSSQAAVKSPPVGSNRHRAGALIFAQSGSTCPCFSLSRLMSTKWDRCIMASLGFPRMLRRVVGKPPNHEVWTTNLNKLRASCECQGTPAGLCTGKGEQARKYIMKTCRTRNGWHVLTSLKR